MKNFRIILFFFTLSAMSFSFSSCGNNAAEDIQGKEYTSEYVCPMHCEGSGSDKEGYCPVCGMDYVKNEDHKADGHTHDNHKDHSH